MGSGSAIGADAVVALSRAIDAAMDHSAGPHRAQTGYPQLGWFTDW